MKLAISFYAGVINFSAGKEKETWAEEQAWVRVRDGGIFLFWTTVGYATAPKETESKASKGN